MLNVIGYSLDPLGLDPGIPHAASQQDIDKHSLAAKQQTDKHRYMNTCMEAHRSTNIAASFLLS